MIRTGHFCPNIAFLCITILFIQALSADFPPVDDKTSGCLLDFTEFPYQPSGQCIGGQHESVKDLSTFPTTLCCQAVLNVLIKNLAWHARNSSTGFIFLLQDQWQKCSGPFLRQQSVSASSCGFDRLYRGSSPCSNFSLQEVPQQLIYKSAVQKCSNFAGFDDSCTGCAQEVLSARDAELSYGHADENSDDDRMVCTVAAVISVAVLRLEYQASVGDHAWVEDFLSCLGALDDFDDGYMRIKHSTVKTVVAVLVLIFIMMLVLLLIQHVSKKKRKNKNKSENNNNNKNKNKIKNKDKIRNESDNPDNVLSESKETSPKPPTIPSRLFREVNSYSGLYRFSKAEIEKAINYGSEKRMLGRGSAGIVYRGLLPSGQAVAIKHLNKSNSPDSFNREVENLSRVRHPNLVCLFGCCIEGGERFLVYEYCPSGNLAQQLMREDHVLSWDQRVKILRDCAQGLKYLHHYVDGCIVHRDIKLTNILLTEKLEPKLSDFGLARMMGMQQSKVFTDVRGTMGYMDPEYMTNAKLTCASDIYSFGIVVLQLLSGQRVFTLDLEARDQLTRKARDVNLGKRPLKDLVDPKLKGDVNDEDFKAILEIAVLAVARSSNGRPAIGEVFDVMEKALKNTVLQSRSYNELSWVGSPTSMSMEGMHV